MVESQEKIPEQIESFKIELDDLKEIVGESFNIDVESVDIAGQEVQVDVKTEEEKEDPESGSG